MDAMLKGYGMNEEKMIRIMQASEVLSAKPIYIDESGTNTPGSPGKGPAPCR